MNLTELGISRLHHPLRSWLHVSLYIQVHQPSSRLKTKLSLLVTPSIEPILQSKDLPSNFNFRHITCVGADTPGKQEVDLEIVKQADLIAFDLFEQGKTSVTTGQISTYSMLRRKIFSVHFDVMNESVAIKVQDEV